MRNLYSTIRYNIPHFLKNVWRFRKALWGYRTYDWGGTVHMLQECLKGLEHAQRTDTMTSVNAPKYVKQIRTCIALCERIRNEDYTALAGGEVEYKEMVWKHLDGGGSILVDTGVRYYNRQTGKKLNDDERRRLFKKEKYIAQQDTEYLGKMIGKYIRYWWT